MITFLVSLAVLIAGFALYGKLTEKVFCVDNRKTPAVLHPDGELGLGAHIPEHRDRQQRRRQQKQERSAL